MVVESHSLRPIRSLFSLLQHLPGISDVGTHVGRRLYHSGWFNNRMWYTGMVANGNRVGIGRGCDRTFGDAKTLLSRHRLAADQPRLAIFVGEAAFRNQGNKSLS